MLVQDRSVSNSPKSQIRQQLHTINHNRFSESKYLDFSTWVSENLYKIIVVLLLVTTIAALFVLRSSSDAASLLQSQSQQHSPSSISLPVIKWNSITPITDRSSVYSMFRSEKWIVFVEKYPSDSLKNLRGLVVVVCVLGFQFRDLCLRLRKSNHLAHVDARFNTLDVLVGDIESTLSDGRLGRHKKYAMDNNGGNSGGQCFRRIPRQSFAHLKLDTLQRITFKIDNDLIHLEHLEPGSCITSDKLNIEPFKVELACLYYLQLPMEKRSKGLLPIIQRMICGGRALESFETFETLKAQLENNLVEVFIGGTC
ncbi:hypothetical protein ACOSQ3_024164 [Xanthoceras sorbifolium]